MQNDIRIRFGKRVRQLRINTGLTQVELAEKFGMDRTYIGGIERGERNVSLVNIEVIAQGFGMSISRLLSGI